VHGKNVVFSSDGYRLHGILHLPDISCPPVVIGSHGLLSSSESPKQRDLAQRCSALGVAFLRFDHRGCGRSQGYFPEVTSLAARAQDIKSAISMVRSRKDTAGAIGLFGSSMGGAACLAVARSVSVDALVTVAAPLRSSTLQLPPESDRWGFTGNEHGFDISDRVDGIRNLMIFHGDADEVVPFDNAVELFQKADSPKRMIRLKNGDHRMENPHHQRRFLQEASQWLVSRLKSTHRMQWVDDRPPPG